MENHPIPQDVTGFKFKLIGSMTIKQFLYLLGFGILAAIMFVLPLSPFIKFPMMAFFGGIGAALAFLPIEGRPMDIMITNFAKTIPSENRYIFKKRGADLASFGIFDAKPVIKITPTQQQTAPRDPAADKRAALVSRLRNSNFRPDENEKQTLNNIHLLFDGKAPIAAAPINLDRTAEESPEEKKQIEQIAEEVKTQEAAPVHENAPVNIAEQKPKYTIRLAGDQASHEMPKEAPEAKAVVEKPNPTLSGGFPSLPDVGNVILGIVRDARGKNLQNIIVEAVDKNGIPVRAFKTNMLGQFAAATPLPDGEYKIHFEDPAKTHEFTDVDVNLNGEIFQPLEITSTDAREKLRRELFGGAVATA